MKPTFSLYLIASLQISIQTVVARPVPGASFFCSETTLSCSVLPTSLPSKEIFTTFRKVFLQTVSQLQDLQDEVLRGEDTPFSNVPITPSSSISRTKALEAPVPLSSVYLMREQNEEDQSLDEDIQPSYATSQTLGDAVSAPDQEDLESRPKNCSHIDTRTKPWHAKKDNSFWDSGNSLLAVVGMLIAFLVVVIIVEATAGDFLDRYFSRRIRIKLLEDCNY